MAISRLCYELYKIDWMQRISSERQKNSLKTYYKEIDIQQVPYEDYIEEQGFDGELYVCPYEFYGAEYKDKEYIKELLNDEELYKEYLKDIEE